MDSAGLDNLWTEAGVYAINTTKTMLHGKAYYRAMRGHQLTYKALWWIKWSMFKSCLAANDHEDQVKVKDLVLNISQLFKKTTDGFRADICGAVSQLSGVLSSEKVQDLMEEFENMHSGNPNYNLWSLYVKMVETLLDFIRTEADGS